VSREDYVSIAARLVAVYIAMNTVQQISQAVPFLREQDPAWTGLYALVLLASFGVCVFLWFFPLTVARKLLPVMKEPRSENTIDAAIGLSLGLTLIGVWFMAQGAVGAVYWVNLIWWTRHVTTPGYFHLWSPENIAGLAATVFEFVVGIGLVFGNTGLRRLIYKLRYGKP
jgi:hypothetical protein